MSRVPTVRKADLDRAIKALRDAGYSVQRIEARPGGVLLIIPALTGAAGGGQVDDLDQRRQRRNAERAAQRPL